ncbi:MAG: cob(I)yrinic acid a,c-diamide adenosyltransferase [Dehalococcoidia bacterium]
MAEESQKSRLYTRSGDAGMTSLFGGGRISKDDPRVEAYGAIDELNSVLGVAVSFIDDEKFKDELAGIQNELFNVGSELASETAGDKAAEFGRMFMDADGKIAALEGLTDELDAAAPTLQTFILPGGSRGGAFLHLGRTVCRRAERRVVALARTEEVNPDIPRYLNRLSDLLFAMARMSNASEGHPETPWRKQ